MLPTHRNDNTENKWNCLDVFVAECLTENEADSSQKHKIIAELWEWSAAVQWLPARQFSVYAVAKCNTMALQQIMAQSIL